jgi:DnaJ-class molecular chaperone
MAGEKITRNVVRTETIEVPEGHKVCDYCDGKGMTSEYDRGARSLAHSPRMASKEECFACHGRGFVEDYRPDA